MLWLLLGHEDSAGSRVEAKTNASDCGDHGGQPESHGGDGHREYDESQHWARPGEKRDWNAAAEIPV